MDEPDISIFGTKKPKQDKSDAHGQKHEAKTAPTEATKKQDFVSRATFEENYDTSNPRVGIALVFNHNKVEGFPARRGTEKDRDRMQHTLETYGFDVRVHNDLTYEKLSEVLAETSLEDHSNNDCLVVAVMTHGNEGKLYAKDISYPVERLWTHFQGENCKSLINKPKLFFVQACRGENVEKPVAYIGFRSMAASQRSFLREPPPVKEMVTYTIPSSADFLIMYSTFEKFYSFRNAEHGSWFIQSLCTILDLAAKSAEATTEGAELLRLLTAVNRKVAYEYQSNANLEALNEKKEMPNFMSSLTKLFYLKVKREDVAT